MTVKIDFSTEDIEKLCSEQAARVLRVPARLIAANFSYSRSVQCTYEEPQEPQAAVIEAPPAAIEVSTIEQLDAVTGGTDGDFEF